MGDRGFIVPIGGAEEKAHDPVILKRFVAMCGGNAARIAIIPTASQAKDTGSQYQKLFRKLGAGEANALPFATRSDCERDDWLAVLRRASGVFLTGGNQTRLAQIVGDSPVTDVLRERNAAGLHIAGTSAGAAFLSQPMIAGDDGSAAQNDTVQLAAGLGLVAGVIIDQHFRQRDRLGRLLVALAANPTHVGLGIDENTAAFIGPVDALEVEGSGAVTIVDPADAEYASTGASGNGELAAAVGLRLHVLTRGGSYNVQTREAAAAEAMTERP